MVVLRDDREVIGFPFLNGKQLVIAIEGNKAIIFKIDHFSDVHS